MKKQLDMLDELKYSVSITKSGWYAALRETARMARPKTQLGFFQRFAVRPDDNVPYILVDKFSGAKVAGPWPTKEEADKASFNEIQRLWAEEIAGELDHKMELLKDATKEENEQTGQPEKLPARRARK